MIVLWLSQTSNITPPIALAAFAAAGVANANPMKTSVEAFKLGAGFFIIPLMMAYSGLMFEDGNVVWFIESIAATIAIIIAMAVLIERYLLVPISAPEAALALVALPLLLMGKYLIIPGLILVAVLVVLQIKSSKQQKAIQSLAG